MKVVTRDWLNRILLPSKHFSRLSKSRKQWTPEEVVNVGKETEAGRAMLCWIGGKADRELAKLLVDAGLPFRAGEESSPLHEAALIRNAEAVRAYLEAGKDANLEDREGATPLHIASMSGCAECVEQLLKFGAGPNRLTEDGQSPLHLAMLAPREVCRWLLKSGADPNLSEENELAYTPVIWSVCLNRPALLMHLLTEGADPDKKSGNGYTPLHVSVLRDRAGMIGMLRSAGASKRIKGRSGRTPLQLAKHMGRNGCIEALKQKI